MIAVLALPGSGVEGICRRLRGSGDIPAEGVRRRLLFPRHGRIDFLRRANRGLSWLMTEPAEFSSAIVGKIPSIQQADLASGSPDASVRNRCLWMLTRFLLGPTSSRRLSEPSAAATFLLAVIGSRWTAVVDDEGHRRLDDPGDFVVLEVRTALEREITVLPVLIDGAPMPKDTELPADIRPLTRRNAIRVDAETFRQDSEWLLDQLAAMLDDRGTAKRRGSMLLSRRKFIGLAAGVAGFGAVGTAIWRMSQNAVGSDNWNPTWSLPTNAEVYSSPAVVNGVVYIGSNDQHLYAISVATGQQVWRCEFAGAVTSSPAVDGETVYVGCNDSTVRAVAAANGQVRWTFHTNGPMHSSPAVDHGVLYIGCRDNNLYAIDTEIGTERWRFPAGDWFNSSAVVADGTVYIGCRDTNVYAVDSSTGQKRWSYTTGSSVDSSAAVLGETLWIGSDDHRLYALDAKTGSWIWDFDAGLGIVSSPLVADGVVYVGCDDGNLYALDASTGRERWRHSTGNQIRSSPAIADGVVYVGSRDFCLYAVDAATGGFRRKFQTGAPIDDSSPLVIDAQIYIGSLDHKVYALSTETEG